MLDLTFALDIRFDKMIVSFDFQTIISKVLASAPTAAAERMATS
jgi:hypothetical protein